MEIKRMFFNSKDKAEEFAAEVDGDIYDKDHEFFELELSVIDYPEGLEEFNYVVVWET